MTTVVMSITCCLTKINSQETSLPISGREKLKAGNQFYFTFHRNKYRYPPL
jgi:hypothetical protein